MNATFRPEKALKPAVCALFLGAVIAPQAALTQTAAGAGQATNPSVLEEVIVFGRNTELLGDATASSEGSVGGADLLVRPMLRVAELLEAVPGMVAVQHSGSGKANQYFLRGFNLDHGTDFTAYVDGVPWNLRSHGHGQGYLDINGLLPETVDRLDYRKGPYRADIGDFSMAGASFIRTIDRLDSPFVALETGENGWQRLAAGGTTDVGEGTLTALGEYKSYDGPWQLNEGLEHLSIWSKYARSTRFGELSLTLSGYEGDWHPTEQIPERVVGSAVCLDVYCTLDTTASGNTSRWIAGAQMTGSDWDASAYLQFYDWFMQSNPTYDFQLNQFDKRMTTGGLFNRTVFETADLGIDVGAEFRYDDIGPVGLDEFNQGAFVDNISNNDIQETSLGAYVEATWYPTDDLRLFGGLRGGLLRLRLHREKSRQLCRQRIRQSRLAESGHCLCGEREHRTLWQLGPRISFQRCARRREYAGAGTRTVPGNGLRSRRPAGNWRDENHDNLLVARSGQ